MLGVTRAGLRRARPPQAEAAALDALDAVGLRDLARPLSTSTCRAASASACTSPVHCASCASPPYLAGETRCFLLDEPTSSLDLAHQTLVLAAVRRQAAFRGGRRGRLARPQPRRGAGRRHGPAGARPGGMAAGPASRGSAGTICCRPPTAARCCTNRTPRATAARSCCRRPSSQPRPRQALRDDRKAGHATSLALKYQSNTFAFEDILMQYAELIRAPKEHIVSDASDQIHQPRHPHPDRLRTRGRPPGQGGGALGAPADHAAERLQDRQPAGTRAA